jgi:rSAM/selenodomain-associated transferase 2
MTSQKSIDVIIPTLNEAETLAGTLDSVRESLDVGVIIVDGGSRDGTLEIARANNVNVIASLPGRAHQMNVGAAASEEDILLFLHADTKLPAGFEAYVRRTLSQPSVVAGAFLLCIAAPRKGLRIIEALANWRSRWLQLPYGDQGIFLSARLFHKVGGFREFPIMEDFELMRRLRREGRIRIAPVPVLTSARRWTRVGICKLTMLNQVAIAAYCLGVAPSRIAPWYQRNTAIPIEEPLPEASSAVNEIIG